MLTGPVPTEPARPQAAPDTGSTATRRAAVLGKPVAHSLSPVIHRAGYRAAGLDDWSYTAVECAETGLADLVAGLGPEWAGLSLTMPLKEVALTVADETTPLAATLGAANTLVHLPDGRWRADNTDAPGIADAVCTAVTGAVPAGPAAQGGTDGGDAAVGPAVDTAGWRVVVLGAGGTARAALGAAARLRAGQVTVVARRPEAVGELTPVAAALAVPLTRRAWPEAPAALAEADLVVSTVPKGVADPIAGQVSWRSATVLLDALYDPWPTPLAASARAAGCRVASGLDLLLAQAVGQFEQFTGVPAPVAAMRAALTTAGGAGGR